MSNPARQEPDSDALPRERAENNPLARLRELIRGELPTHVAPAVSAPAADERQAASTAARVSVRRERAGRGGKTVTIVAGAGLAGRDLTELARDAAKSLGTGARAADGTLVVQGDQAERVVKWLGARGFGAVQRAN